MTHNLYTWYSTAMDTCVWARWFPCLNKVNLLTYLFSNIPILVIASLLKRVKMWHLLVMDLDSLHQLLLGLMPGIRWWKTGTFYNCLKSTGIWQGNTAARQAIPVELIAERWTLMCDVSSFQLWNAFYKPQFVRREHQFIIYIYQFILSCVAKKKQVYYVACIPQLCAS